MSVRAAATDTARSTSGQGAGHPSASVRLPVLKDAEGRGQQGLVGGDRVAGPALALRAAATASNSTRAAVRSSTISRAMISGAGRLSRSSRESSLSQI